MSYPFEVSAALTTLEATGIWRFNYAPPLYRLAWNAGISLPPPHFARFTFNFIFSTIWFGIVWSLLMWSRNFPHHGKSVIATIGGSVAAGILFGFFMALYYRHGAHKYRLPTWSSIQVLPHSKFT
ncbi:DUF6404 family protein [Collimonas arenae]|uniref:DUF6404 family protein n=1 Tax=Collimonas arenae TaxID=279058 RepID=UPI000FE13CB2|nr:DUF6404 family protein [Collimonas arenae]